MFKVFSFLALIVFFTLNSYAQLDKNVGYEQNRIVVKLKSNYNLSPGTISIINSDINTSQIGINSIDNVSAQYKLKDISQVFPHHSEPAFQAMIKEKTGKELNTLENIFYYEFKDNISVSQLCKDLERLPEVEYAEPVYKRSFTDVPNDGFYDELHHLPQIFAEEAWDIAKGEEGAEVIVGICDSGIDWFHPDLIDNLKTNLGEDLDGDGKVIQYNEETGEWEFDPDDVNGIDDDGNGFADDFVGWNFAYMTDDTPPNDPRGSEVNDHGTHVTGLAAGVTNNTEGIASISWNVKFMPTKHSDNSSGRILHNGYEGIVYLAENGADIINMSWGGPGFSSFEWDVINYVNSLDVILVSSAGNSNNEDITYPPAFPGVISVASVAADDTKASYSSFGAFVDIAAPGGDRYNGGALLSTLPNNDYGMMQGTSMASPVAAGMFALVKSYFPEYSKEEIIATVLGTTDDLSEQNPGYDYLLGTGRINALKALTEEPVLNEGLILSSVNYTAIYEDEDGTIYELPNLYAGGEFQLKVTVFNSNNFYGNENLTANLYTNSEDINVISDSYSSSIGADSYVDFYFSLEVTNEEFSSLADFYIEFSTSEDDILFGESVEFDMLIDNGGILVWQPVLEEMGDVFGSYENENEYPGINNPQFSGGYINNYLKNQGHNVVFTDKILPDISNFEAIYASVGNVYMPDLNSWGESLLMMLQKINEYLMTNGPDAKLFMESNNIFSHINFSQFGIDFNPIIFGLQEINFNESEYTQVANVLGSEGSLLEDVLFEESEQYYSYELDYVVPHPAFSIPLLEIEDFGTVMTFGTNPFGNTIFYSTVTIGQLVDESCPSTRENILRVIKNFFGIMAPMNIVLEDVETCKNIPVSIGADDTQCGRLRPISNAVTGGSGAFIYEWAPSYGLDDANSVNPVLLEPVIDRTYTVTATDIFTGETATKNIAVKVNEGAKAKVPLIIFHPMLTPINLNDKIISITGGTEPYLEYVWTDQYGEEVDGEGNEIPEDVVNRYYLTVYDSGGCPSKTVRMIVFAGMFKEFNEDDIEISANGSLLLTSYPNPAYDKINVLSVFENTTNAKISIIDMSGREVLSFTRNSVSEINEELNISDLSAGTYIISIETDNDKLNRKFIKQ